VRGELWTVSGGVYAAKPRPALILQSDLFAGTNSVTVAPLTTTALDAPLLRVPVAAEAPTGLAQPSWVMIDKVTTVRRDALGHHLGRLSADDLLSVERLVAVFLGLAH
jgi:mRNA interferase MazF